VPKRKDTVEDHLDFIRWLRDVKGLKHRESKHYLKELRQERGLTQKLLAERAGVSQQFISRIESNWVNAGPKTIRRLASALEMDPLELTLIEVIYRDTLAHEEYYYLDDRHVKVEELDVDQWTLSEAVDWASDRFFYPSEVDEDGYVEAGSPGIESQEAADRANAAMRRLRERYSSQELRDEDYWWE
jgi:transcriptional regulator with XRE-family HTH domain